MIRHSFFWILIEAAWLMDVRVLMAARPDFRCASAVALILSIAFPPRRSPAKCDGSKVASWLEGGGVDDEGKTVDVVLSWW
jgi:hypothetical protein